MLEHVTHEVTISALPTAIPESIPADVSGMVIGDTLQLERPDRARGRRVRPRRGPERRRDHDRHPVAAAGRGGARARARGGGRARRRGRRADRAAEGEDAEGEAAEGGDAGDSGDSGEGVALSPVRRRGERTASPSAAPAIGSSSSGFGNPGSRYAATRHNVGFEVAAELARSWELPKPKQKYRGADHRGTGPPRRTARRGAAAADLHERVRRLRRAGARGAQGAARAASIVVHDEIDLPFGEIQAKLGGGVAGHNGLKSLADGFGEHRLLARAGRRRPPRLDRPGDRLRLRARALQRAGESRSAR